MLLVTVFQVRHLNINNKSSSNITIMPRTAENPFSPPKLRPTVNSTNHKTILNRTYARSKCGLEISDHHDDRVYRSKKYRALKKLRTSDGWISMSQDEQQDAIDALVSKLEDERITKKCQHEKDWILWKDREEGTAVAGTVNKGTDVKEGNDDTGDDYTGDEWNTESETEGAEVEEADPWETEEGEGDETEEDGKRRLGKELKKVVDQSGACFNAKLQILETAAKKKYIELFSEAH
jgi:hypothetical protein